MSEPINELRGLKNTIRDLAGELGGVAVELIDVLDTLDVLHLKVSRLNVSDVGREQLMKKLSECERQLAVLLNAFIRDAVVRKLNVTVSNLTKNPTKG